MPKRELTTAARSRGDAGTITRAVIYTRFSPRPDAADSESCDFQRAKCEEFAAQKGWEVRAVFDDPDRSGADEYREQLWHAVDALKKGDRLLVYKRDRLARDVYLACQIERMVAHRAAEIVAVSGDIEGDTPEAQMVRVVVAAMSEYERKLIKRRTSDAMLAYQKGGRRMSCRVPYGYRVAPGDETMLLPDEHERAIIREVMGLHRGGTSWLAICDRLNSRGEFKRNGSPWHRGEISVIIPRAEKRIG